MEPSRLSISRRGEIALPLWGHYLEKHGETARLAALNDPALAPHSRLTGHYAFESFLGEYRGRFAARLEETAVYNEAWVRVSLEHDDRIPRTEHSITRLASALFVEDAAVNGQIQKWGESWFEEAVGWDSPIGRDDCVAFVGEIVHELFVELIAARILARSLNS